MIDMGKVEIYLKNGNKEVKILWEGWNLETDEDFEEELLEEMAAIGFTEANRILAYKRAKAHTNRFLKKVFWTIRNRG